MSEHVASPHAPKRDAQDDQDDRDGGVFFVCLSFKGSLYEVPVQAEDSVASIFDFVQEVVDFPRENCKLIHQGRMMLPDRDALTVGEARLQAGSKLMLVATSAQDAAFVRSARPDPLVKGFEEEARDERGRRRRARAAAASAWGTKQDAQYRFNSIKAEFKYSEPPPFEAEKLLERLATDPGLIDIMTSRRFTVGILTEMSPVEAQERMAQRGTPNLDLLGYNQNFGEKIVLRLRTDTLKGFRPYHDIMNTLIHELTHNVWGPHDHNFWKLYGELKAQYMKFHRFWSHGGRAADSAAAGPFQGFQLGAESDTEQPAGGFGRALGSGAGVEDKTPRSRRLRAAEARAARVALGDGPDEPPRPNFLAGDRSWVVLCPCGQIHDPAICDVARARTAAVGDETSRLVADRTDAASKPMEVASGRGADPGTFEAEGAHSCGNFEGAASMDVDVTPASASSFVSRPSPLARDSQGLADDPMPAAEPNADEPCGAGAAEAPAEVAPDAAAAGRAAPQGALAERAPEAPRPVHEAVPDLDLAELEAQGLDGATVWIQRFSQRLAALRASRGPAAAHAAAELLLRLARNAAGGPQEPKFRRIRADNPRVRSTLLVAGQEAEVLMAMLGFEATSEPGGARAFVLRDAAFDPVRLRLGGELLEQEAGR